MRNIRLDAINFMGYETLSLDLTGIRTLAITGKNNHGKSSLSDAITFCCYGKVGARPIDTRQHDQFIRNGTDFLSVTFAFTTSDGHDILVVREKPRGQTETLSLLVDGVSSKGHTLAETQDRIIDWIGLTYEGLTMTNFMVQRGSSAFMAAAPRERKDLLITLRGLNRYKPLWTAASKELADAKAELRVTELGRANLEIVKTEAAPARALLADAQDHVAQARTSKESWWEATTAIREALSGLRAQQAALGQAAARRTALEAERAELIAAGKTRAEAFGVAKTEATSAPPAGVTIDPVTDAEVAAAELRRDDLRDAAAEQRRLTDQLKVEAAAVTEAERLRAILPNVPCGGQGIYATCRFLTSVPTEAKVTTLRETEATTRRVIDGLMFSENDVMNAQIAYATLKARQRTAEAAITEANTAHAAWVAKVDAAKQRLVDLTAAHATAKDRVAAIKAELSELDAGDANLSVLTADIAFEEAGLKTTIVGLRAAEEALAATEADERRLLKQVAVFDDALSHEPQIIAANATAEAAVKIMTALTAAWHRDGIPSADIDEAVPLIEAKANEVLARLPEGLRIQMVNEPEALDVFVEIGGYERPYGLISVGARFRIDLALRLALGEIQTHSTGRRIELLWLDEALADMDDEGEEAVMETLGALRDDFGLIAVVSHRPRVTEGMESRVEVVKENEICRATLAA